MNKLTALNYLKWLEAEKAKASKNGEPQTMGDAVEKLISNGEERAFAKAIKRLKKLLE